MGGLPLTASQVDQLDVLPLLDPLVSTDEFPVYRVGSSTPLQKTTLAQLLNSVGFGSNPFQVTNSNDSPMVNQTGTGGDIKLNFNTRSGGTEPQAFDPTNVFNPTFVPPFSSNPGGQGTNTCTVSGTTLTVTVTTFLVQPLQQVTGPGVPVGTIVTAYGSGVGRTGTYTVNNSFTIAAPTDLTFTNVVPSFIAPQAGLYRIYCQANMEVISGQATPIPLGLYLQQSNAAGTYVAEAVSSIMLAGAVNSIVSMLVDAVFDCQAGDWIFANVQYEYPNMAGTLMTCYGFQSYMGGYAVSLAAVPVTTPDQTIIPQLANFTLIPSMDGALILAANIAITVDLNTNQPFGIGARIDIQATNSVPCTIAPVAGVTINSVGGSLALAAQWSAASLIQTATDIWSLVGDLA